MRGDDIALGIVEVKIPLGIGKGKTVMFEPVPAEALVGVMPVIQIIVMQQCPAHQRVQITLHPIAHRQRIGGKRHLDTMAVHGHIRVGNILLHLCDPAAWQNFAKHPAKGGIIHLPAHFFLPHFC